MTKKKQKAVPEKLAELMANLSFAELVAKLMSESPIEGEMTKLCLAESAAALRFELRFLLAKQKEGKIRAEEVRVIPGLASNLRRILERLGTTQPVEEDFDF